MTFVHEPNKPTADGICYVDTHGMPIPVLTMLSHRGLVYMTEFKWGLCDFGGDIIAGSLDAAHDVAFARGLGEKVVGRYTNIQPRDDDSGLWFAEFEEVESESSDARNSFKLALPARTDNTERAKMPRP